MILAMQMPPRMEAMNIRVDNRPVFSSVGGMINCMLGYGVGYMCSRSTEACQRVVSALSPAQRELICLTVIKRGRVDTIAKGLGRPPSDVLGDVYRGLELLDSLGGGVGPVMAVVGLGRQQGFFRKV